MIRTIALTAILLFFLSSCGAAKGYHGASRPESETASLTGYGVTLRQVNEREIGSTASSVRVLPGENIVQFTSNAGNYNMLGDARRRLTIAMVAEAGKNYAITSKRGSRRVCAFEIDQATGKPDFQKSAGCYQTLRKPAGVSQQLLYRNQSAETISIR